MARTLKFALKDFQHSTQTDITEKFLFNERYTHTGFISKITITDGRKF